MAGSGSVSISKGLRPARPVKHTVQCKPTVIKAVTGCIAGECLENGEPRIVLCADGRLSAGYLGSTNTAIKIREIGHDWAALLSGDWDLGCELVLFLKQEFTKADPPDSRPGVLKTLRNSLSAFVSSSLFVPDKSVALIVAGFIRQDPTMFRLDIYEHDSQLISPVRTFASVGEGADIATSILNHRDFRNTRSLEEALYLIFEAKRFSESVASVGPKTVMVIVPPTSSVPIRTISPQGIRELDKYYRKFGLQKIKAIKPIGSEWFM